MQDLREHINSLAETISQDTELTKVVSPSEIKAFLLNGMSTLINRANTAERRVYLNNNPEDTANGFSPSRNIMMGTTPVTVSVPRTRSSNFYPQLFTKYERTIPEDYEAILRELILNAKNFSSVKRTLRGLKLPYRAEEVDTIIAEIYDEAKIFNGRRVSPDWHFIYIDAKVIDMINENKKMDKAVVFTVVGISNECKKEILSIQLFWGNESTDLWKKVLVDLRNRGLTRVSLIVTDDFSGLTSIVKSLFPSSDHQLCQVHLLRNALRHLNSDEYTKFKQKIDDICMSSDFECAQSAFLELTDSIKAKYPAYAAHLHKRATQFCAFTKFPRDLRSHIRSTNTVEGMNNGIEIIQRNSGGLFHSEREFFVKLQILSASLHSRKWKSPISKIKAHIHDLTRIFSLKFEQDDPI